MGIGMHEFFDALKPLKHTTEHRLTVPELWALGLEDKYKRVCDCWAVRGVDLQYCEPSARIDGAVKTLICMISLDPKHGGLATSGYTARAWHPIFPNDIDKVRELATEMIECLFDDLCTEAARLAEKADQIPSP